jgi:hypothetical protein
VDPATVRAGSQRAEHGNVPHFRPAFHVSIPQLKAIHTATHPAAQLRCPHELPPGEGGAAGVTD